MKMAAMKFPPKDVQRRPRQSQAKMAKKEAGSWQEVQSYLIVNLGLELIYLQCAGDREGGEDIIVQIDNVPDMPVKYQKTNYTANNEYIMLDTLF